MIDREKVVKGLEIHTKPNSRCVECPYPNNGLCRDQLYHDALILLKEQEEQIKNRDESLEKAREEITWLRGMLKEQEIKSMTLEELDEIYEKQDTHIWPFDTPPYLWMTVNPDVRLTDGFWICWRDIMYSIKNESPFYVRENYGKAWLIWTGKPTQEQVQAVKWNE